MIVAAAAGVDDVEAAAFDRHLPQDVAAVKEAARVMLPRPVNAGPRAVHADTSEPHAIQQIRVEPVAAGRLQDAHSATQPEPFHEVATVPPELFPEGVLPPALLIERGIDRVAALGVGYYAAGNVHDPYHRKARGRS